MKGYFKKSEEYNCDCFVADYSNQTDSKKGVIIARSPFVDIAFFHLKKKNSQQNLKYLGVNLEHYPAFTSGIENCECIFYSLAESKKTWVLFLETKYCDAGNIENYETKTVSQMCATLEKLEYLGLLNRSNHRIYFVYSVPEHDELEPFFAFHFTPDFILKLEEQGIKFHGYNTMLIATPNYLEIPKKDI